MARINLSFKLLDPFKVFGKKDKNAIKDIMSVSYYKNGVEVEKEFHLDLPVFVERIQASFDTRSRNLKITMMDRNPAVLKEAAKAARKAIVDFLQELEDEVEEILNP